MPARTRSIATLSITAVLVLGSSLLGQTTANRRQVRINPVLSRVLGIRSAAKPVHLRRPNSSGKANTIRHQAAQHVKPVSHVNAAPVRAPAPPQAVPVVMRSSQPSHSRVACGKSCRCGSPYEPLGASFYAHFDSQILNGQKAQQVLYQYDFENGPANDRTQLNLAGRKKLVRLLPLIETTGAPLMIERVDGRPEISEARRLNTVSFLQSQLGMAIAESQVVVGHPAPLGIRGVEAQEIERNQLRTTRAQGTTFSAFTSSQSSNTSTGQGTNSR